jgi:sortase B
MKQGHRDNQRRRRRKPRNIVLTAFCVGLVAILLGMGIYVAQWYLNLGRIRTEGERYARMYGGREVTPTPQPVTPTPQPVSPTDTPTPTRQPIATPTSEPTPSPTPVPAVGPDANMPVVVDEPIPAGATLPATVSPEVTPVPVNTPDTDMPIPVDVPIPTPDSDTLVIALPTAPPVQESFKTLLAANPDTVGFLEIEGMLSLPVVQRPNDNDYYLDHSFEGAKAQEGTLFLDGMNRLVPEDDCLIVYGHNMKNRTMFGRLSAYADISHLRQYPVVHFDTLYENRSYVAFAAFSASMKPGDSHYFDVRNFIFDKDGFDNFVLKLKGRSVFSSPIEVLYGDHLLLLVTCDYSNREGRFILALRQLRANENEGNMFAEALRAEMK